MSIESQGKLGKSQGKVREKSGNSVSKIWQTPCMYVQDKYNKTSKDGNPIRRTALHCRHFPLSRLPKGQIPLVRLAWPLCGHPISYSFSVQEKLSTEEKSMSNRLQTKDAGREDQVQVPWLYSFLPQSDTLFKFSSK